MRTEADFPSTGVMVDPFSLSEYLQSTGQGTVQVTPDSIGGSGMIFHKTRGVHRETVVKAPDPDSYIQTVTTETCHLELSVWSQHQPWRARVVMVTWKETFNFQLVYMQDI